MRKVDNSIASPFYLLTQLFVYTKLVNNFLIYSYNYFIILFHFEINKVVLLYALELTLHMHTLTDLQKLCLHAEYYSCMRKRLYYIFKPRMCLSSSSTNAQI